MRGGDLVVLRPDGRRFLTPREAEKDRIKNALLLEQVQAFADQQQKRAEEAERRADEVAKQRDEVSHKFARYSELSRKARRGQATPDELAELDRLDA
jgi:hypothetical protein